METKIKDTPPLKKQNKNTIPFTIITMKITYLG